MNVDEKDVDRGLYRKFKVFRADGRDVNPDDPHHGCAYFVLDLDHDPHALPALVAYARSAEEAGFGPLADDLRQQVRNRSKVWVYRVHYGGTPDGGEVPDPRPPMWVYAASKDDARAVADISEDEPAGAEPVRLEDFGNFIRGSDSVYPLLMRCALYSAEEEAGDFGKGFILADGRGRSDDGEIRTGGALGE